MLRIRGLQRGRLGLRVDVRVLRAFEASGLEYALIGAAAMGLHGIVSAVETETKVVQGTRVSVATPMALYRLYQE